MNTSWGNYQTVQANMQDRQREAQEHRLAQQTQPKRAAQVDIKRVLTVLLTSIK